MSTADRQQQAPTPVRLPDDLKAALKGNATANDRSLNGEVIARLRDSFQPDGMTLRDYFAVHASEHDVQCALEGINQTVGFDLYATAVERNATARYACAEAMLKARAAS